MFPTILRYFEHGSLLTRYQRFLPSLHQRLQTALPRKGCAPAVAANGTHLGIYSGPCQDLHFDQKSIAILGCSLLTLGFTYIAFWAHPMLGETRNSMKFQNSFDAFEQEKSGDLHRGTVSTPDHERQPRPGPL